MELSLVFSAIRRRWWIIVVFAALGAGLPMLLEEESTITYESKAVLLVAPPSSASGAAAFTNDLDRYIADELAVLGSDDLAEQVAAAIGEDDPRSVKRAVVIEQRVDTDIVEVVARASDPTRARDIAQQYALLYTAGQIDRAEQSSAIDQIEDRLRQVSADLADVNELLAEAVAPYLALLDQGIPIPTAETLNPDAVSRRNLLTAEATQLQTAINNQQLLARAQANTAIIQAASLPTNALPTSGGFTAIGVFVGFMVGIAVAISWSRFSSFVADEVELTEIVGAPAVGELRRAGTLTRNPAMAFDGLPRSLTPLIDQLGVRAEALAQVNEPLTVAVVGTERGAGASTLAMALAGRLTRHGTPLILADADGQDPTITELFGAWSSGGIPSLIDAARTGGFEAPNQMAHTLAPTSRPEARVVGFGYPVGSVLSRDAVQDVLDITTRMANIVIIDAGPLLESAAAVRLCRLVDAVVLAVPLSKQKSSHLADVSRQLDGVHAKLLPVITHPSRRRRKMSFEGPSPGAPGTTAPAPAETRMPVGAAVSTSVSPAVSTPKATTDTVASMTEDDDPSVDAHAEAEEAYRAALDRTDDPEAS